MYKIDDLRVIGKKLVRIGLLLAITFLITIISSTAYDEVTQSPHNIVETDNSDPVINILSPLNGSAFKENSSVTVNFTVSDQSTVELVLVNDIETLPISGNQYSQTVELVPGENLIIIEAVDSSDNIGEANLVITYSPDKKVGNGADSEPLPEKEVLILPENAEDISNEIINQLSADGNKIDIGSLFSVEISNLPEIPEGETAKIEIPEIKGIESVQENEIPKGFSFATNIDLNDTDLIQSENNNQNIALLTDGSGRSFVVGFALRSVDSLNSLISTFTVPADASEGEAKISIINGNESIATIPIVIRAENDVRNRKDAKGIFKPEIIEPIIPSIKKSGSILKLRIKGKNFIGRSAIIDGKLEKLVSKAQFFTNVTFVPSNGIRVKQFKIINNTILLTAELNKNIKPGIKLFNVITPKGSDIGAIIFPDSIVNGKLQSTASPENLLIESTGEVPPDFFLTKRRIGDGLEKFTGLPSE